MVQEKFSSLLARDGVLGDDEGFKNTLFTLLKDCIATSISIVVSQPFFVICVRTIAQFTGQEKTYR